MLYWLAGVVLLPLAGCSHSTESLDLPSETGRGTFVSTNRKAVTAMYSKRGDEWTDARVQLFLPDKTPVELYLALSGSGARYTNATAEWWEHQGEAVYSASGSNVFRGKSMPSK